MSTTTTTVRRLPLPASEPPFDDEAPPPHHPQAGVVGAMQGTLALAFTLPSGVSAVPPVPPTLHLVSQTTTAPQAHAALHDPRVWAGRLVQAVLEVLGGERPLAQLVRWTSAETYADLQRRVHASARLRPPQRRDGSKAAVRSVRVCQPRDDVAEVAVTVRRGSRTTAVALRLEGLDGRWQCTALDFC
jgi:hypothetical protein